MIIRKRCRFESFLLLLLKSAACRKKQSPLG